MGKSDISWICLQGGTSMHWQFTPYVLPVIVSALVSAALAFSAWCGIVQFAYAGGG